MKYFFANTFFIVFLLFPIVNENQEAEWELKKEEDGIRVYTREVEGSNIREFKASSHISASQETIYNILLDIPNYPKWIEDVEEASILSKAENERDFHYQLSLPWPMKDRDIAMSMKIYYQDDQSILLKLTSNSLLVPENDDFIRMYNVVGEWLVTPMDDSNCQVTYQFLADPEGFLPAWVINIFIIDGPFKTLKNLQEYSLIKK